MCALVYLVINHVAFAVYMSSLPVKTLIHSHCLLLAGRVPISVNGHREWSPVSGHTGMTSTSPLCTMQQAGPSDGRTPQIQIEFKYMVHHGPPCLIMSLVIQARSPQGELSKRLWLGQSRTQGRTVRRQAWRDSPGHTNTHLRDFQVTPYVPHSATGLSGC